jgi:hypothetical protein
VPKDCSSEKNKWFMWLRKNYFNLFYPLTDYPFTDWKNNKLLGHDKYSEDIIYMCQ